MTKDLYLYSYWGRGGQQPKTVCHFHSFLAGVTKIHDFVHFNICLVPVKLFLKKIVKFWKIEKKRKRIYCFDTRDLRKKIKKIKNHFIFFQTIISFDMFLAFFLRYITSVLLKIFNFSFFSYEISIQNHFHSLTSSGKNNHQKRLFWVSMDS